MSAFSLFIRKSSKLSRGEKVVSGIVQVGKPIGTFYGLKSVDITDDGLWLVENKKVNMF